MEATVRELNQHTADVLARVEERGFAISPRQGDVFVGPGGAVVLARARGARRLPPGAHLDARVALLKNYREDIEQTFRDYKKFRTETKITVVGEESR